MVRISTRSRLFWQDCTDCKKALENAQNDASLVGGNLTKQIWGENVLHLVFCYEFFIPFFDWLKHTDAPPREPMSTKIPNIRINVLSLYAQTNMFLFHVTTATCENMIFQSSRLCIGNKLKLSFIVVLWVEVFACFYEVTVLWCT